MANSAIDRALQDDQGNDTAFDMALKIFTGEVMRTFTAKTRAFDLTKKKGAKGHKTEQMIAVANSGTAESHTPGTEIVGQLLEKEERTIVLEDEETIKFSNLSILDKFISQYDVQIELGYDAGRALAAAVENHVLRKMVIGAKLAARGSFVGGQMLAADRTGANLAAAYPMSLAGSKALQDDIAEIVQNFKDDDVPTDDLYCFLRHREHRVLRQDNTLLSSDYTDRALADKINGKLLKVEECWLIPTTYFPTATYAAATSPTINGTAAYLADCTDVAAIITRPGAVGSLIAEGISPAIDWIPRTRVWQIGAAMLKGHAYLRPESLGVVQIAGE